MSTQSLQRELQALRDRVSALEDSERKYRLLAENTADIIWTTDDEGRYTYVSPSVTRLLGYSPEKAVGRSIFGALPLASARRARRAFRQASQAAETAQEDYAVRVEIEHYTQDGKTIWFEVLARPQRGINGEPGWLGISRDISQRKRDEDALRQSEARFRRLFEDAALGVFLVDQDTYVTDCNKAALRILGYKREELIGMKGGEQLHPDDIAATPPEEILAKAAEQGSLSLERRYRRRDGNYIPVLLNIKLLPGTGQYLVMFQDITESKQAKARLEEFRLLLTAMTDNMMDMLWAKDTQGRFLFANKAVREGLLICDGIDPLGKTDTFFALRQREQGQQHTFGELCFDSDKVVLESGRPGRFVEDGLIRGRYLALDVQKSPLYDPSGRLTGTVGTARDITEKLEREQALKKSRQELELTLDATNDSIWSYEIPADVIRTSPKILDILGYKEGEIAPEDCLADANLHPDDLSIRNRRLWDYVTGVSRDYFAEFRLRAKDGSWKWIYTRGSIVERDATGAPVRIIGAHTNITELKKVQEDLTLAKDAAENATRAKSEFLANMSHELRTPLNGMFGMLQLLQLTELDDEQEEYVQTSLATGRSLMAIINDVLDFSKMEAGLVDIAMEPFNLKASLDMVINNFTVQARDKGLVVALDIPDDVPTDLVGDEGRLRQILFNLVGNAVKFTDKGRVDIQVVRLPRRRQGEDVRLLFSVSDTGIGIPPDQQLRVFDAFTQADGAYTRRFAGTGLGLGIVRKLVTRMDGAMSVESEPGEGTCVHFVLPFGLTWSKGRRGAPAGSAKKLKPLSILLVEDELVNQMAARMFLVRHGHTVTCAGNGRQALEHLDAGHFDCVLMDVQMPEMDGLTATRIIRASDKPYRHIPIIAMTAHAMAQDRATFLAAGMDDHIAKPVDMEKLERAISGLLPD